MTQKYKKKKKKTKKRKKPPKKQVGKFIVGQPEGSDEIIPEDHVPAGQRFPAMFRGEGVRGHQYHVFSEPR